MSTSERDEEKAEETRAAREVFLTGAAKTAEDAREEFIVEKELERVRKALQSGKVGRESKLPEYEQELRNWRKGQPLPKVRRGGGGRREGRGSSVGARIDALHEEITRRQKSGGPTKTLEKRRLQLVRWEQDDEQRRELEEELAALKAPDRERFLNQQAEIKAERRANPNAPRRRPARQMTAGQLFKEARREDDWDQLRKLRRGLARRATSIKRRDTARTLFGPIKRVVRGLGAKVRGSAMHALNGVIMNVLERVAIEAGYLVQYRQAATMKEATVRAAMELVYPPTLGRLISDDAARIVVNAEAQRKTYRDETVPADVRRSEKYAKRTQQSRRRLEAWTGFELSPNYGVAGDPQVEERKEKYYERQRRAAGEVLEMTSKKGRKQARVRKQAQKRAEASEAAAAQVS